ncbi:MAG: dihydropteroate synthase [Desulfobulbaceae bacterium]|nr:dihydropteroate synthase [Desulfobulbaceae bacterium]
MIFIAEKINGSIPSAKEIIEQKDTTKLLALVEVQALAGADYIDVNVGTGSGNQLDEIEAMHWAVTSIQEKFDVPLCIDSADPKVLAAGLAARDGRPALINSTKGSDKYIAAIVPLASEYNAPLVCLAMDEDGIPKTVDKRVAACEKIAVACVKNGVALENLYFDPLVLPVATDVQQGLVTLDTIRAIKKSLPQSKTVMALSNISFGLPQRKIFNTAFFHMAIFAGLDGAILNVLDHELVGGAKTAEAIMGRDRHCRRYSRFWRSK